MIKPFDKVKILRTDIAAFAKRKKPVYGEVIRRDGDYVYVRPFHWHKTIELYDCELEVCK